MFKLSEQTIDAAEEGRKMSSNEAGAFVCFEGRVRNHNVGKAVLRLEYEAYPALAEKEASLIMNEASERFTIIAASCIHRTGLLEIGDIAVWVGVLSRHRAEGFDACRFIIDEIKARVPIWKKEYYVDETAEWVNCAQCSSHAHSASFEHSDDTSESSPANDFSAGIKS